jgi:hypothetical protein
MNQQFGHRTQDGKFSREPSPASREEQALAKSSKHANGTLSRYLLPAPGFPLTDPGETNKERSPGGCDCRATTG